MWRRANGDDDIDSLLETYLPHVLVWDLGWNPVGRLASLSRLAESASLVLALLADDFMRAQARAAEARGLLLRNTSIDDLVAALASAARGLSLTDPSLSLPATIISASPFGLFPN